AGAVYAHHGIVNWRLARSQQRDLLWTQFSAAYRNTHKSRLVTEIRFGPLCGLKSDISQGPRRARCVHSSRCFPTSTIGTLYLPGAIRTRKPASPTQKLARKPFPVIERQRASV